MLGKKAFRNILRTHTKIDTEVFMVLPSAVCTTHKKKEQNRVSIHWNLYTIMHMDMGGYVYIRIHKSGGNIKRRNEGMKMKTNISSRLLIEKSIQFVVVVFTIIY